MLPGLSSCSIILSGVDVSHGLPLTVHSNCSERLWLRARTFLVALKNRLGWPGEPIEDARFLLSPLTTPPLWPPKRECSAVSAERSMKFGNIVQLETLRYLTKITAPQKKVARARFLQPSIRFRYNYHVQLVAIKRHWMRVPNLVLVIEYLYQSQYVCGGCTLLLLDSEIT